MSEPLPEKPLQEEPPRRDDWTQEAMKYYRHENATLKRLTLANSLGVSITSLRRLAVGCGRDRRGEFSTWPEKDAEGRIVGIVRRYDDGAKLTMLGSYHGIYFPKDWKRGSQTIFIVEGGSDTASLLTAGVCAIGRPSNTGGVQDLADLLKDNRRTMVVVAERDRKTDRIGGISSCRKGCQGCPWCWPGKYGAISVSEQLTKKLGREVHWILPDLGVKDVREWLAALGPQGLKAALNRRVASAH